MSNEIRYPEDQNEPTRITPDRENKKDDGFKWWPLLLLPVFFFLGWASRGEPERTNETRVEGVSTTGELYDAGQNNSSYNNMPNSQEPTYSIAPQSDQNDQ